MQTGEQGETAGWILSHKLAQRIHGQVQIWRYTGGGLLGDFARGFVPRQVLEGGSLPQQVVGQQQEHSVPEAGPSPRGGGGAQTTGTRDGGASQ